MGAVALAGSLAASDAAAALALTLTHTDKALGEAYQQQADDPCILGDTSCKSPAGWYYPFTNNGGSSALIDKWSFGTDGFNSETNTFDWTVASDKYLKIQGNAQEVGPFYTFGQLSNVLTCGLVTGCVGAPTDEIAFFVGIDTNGSSVPQNLTLFDIWECAPNQSSNPSSSTPVTCEKLAGYANAGAANLVDPDTGTGWTNYILTNPNLKFTADKWYAFHAVYQQNGGSDSFFLINGGTPPDEVVPLPGTLALLGVGLVGLVRARRVGKARAD